MMAPVSCWATSISVMGLVEKEVDSNLGHGQLDFLNVNITYCHSRIYF